jgi:electron transport complex protein RnfG
MKETTRYGFILSLICMVAAGLLAGVNSLTSSKIISQANAEETAGLKEVLPLADYFEPVKSGDKVLYYKGVNAKGEPLGLAFKASGKGYSSTIETLAGMSYDGKISAIKILSQNETPGLGTRVNEGQFLGQFSGKMGTELNGVQAITGASISSKAIIDSVKAKAQEILSLVKNGKQ